MTKIKLLLVSFLLVFVLAACAADIPEPNPYGYQEVTKEEFLDALREGCSN